ncbi:MAG: serine hydrolase domain-containing protein [Planctomycetaceae bacterium]
MTSTSATSMSEVLNRICSESRCPFVDVDAGSAAGTSVTFQFTERSKVDLPAARLPQRRYLVASITKPIVATAFLKLVAEGRVSLTERIGEHLPMFRSGSLRRITFRHLLTHTSGLPDMLPNNAELRAAHATLKEFIMHAAGCEPDFVTGSDCRYSSVGFLLLGAAIEQLSAQTLPDYLRENLFEPLHMSDSWQGIPAEQDDAIAASILPCDLPEWQPDADDWGWNSRYWRTLGAPWGGLISTAEDLSRFARMMLREGTGDDGIQVLPPIAVRAAMREQTRFCDEVPEATRNDRPWGYGWRMQWANHRASFGDFVSPETAGHWGATGTLLWIDPTTDNYAVILTTTPYEQSCPWIQRISNVIAARGHDQS